MREEKGVISLINEINLSNEAVIILKKRNERAIKWGNLWHKIVGKKKEEEIKKTFAY